ncbi:MAG: deoxyribose-phosphate aldolase, partial [Actinomycetes bacterium]
MTATASPPVGQQSELASVAAITASDSTLRRFLHGLPGVDQVGADARAATLSTRSIKTSAKLWAIDLAITMI